MDGAMQRHWLACAHGRMLLYGGPGMAWATPAMGEVTRQDTAGVGCVTCLRCVAVEKTASRSALTPNWRYDITCASTCQLLTVGNYRQNSVLVNLTNSSNR